MNITCLAGQSRLPAFCGLICTLLTQMLWWASPAQSQSLLQQIFGLSPSPQVYTAPRPAPMRPAAGTGPMRIDPALSAASTPRDRANGNVAPEGTGSYTTMCVRTCDGFYFPISHRVPRSRFQRDADACRSRCGQSEARLFFHSTGQDMKSAVDVTGRTYVRMPTAFLHRKKLVAGCGCKPEPWSQAALSRHEGFAIAEGRSLPGGGRPAGSLTVIAGNYPDKPAAAPAATNPAEPDAASPAAPGHDQPSTTLPSLTIGAAGASLTAAPASALPPAKSIGHSTRTGAVAQSQQRPTASRQAARTVAAKAQASAKPAAPRKPSSIASAGTGARMVWPGDAPVRVR